MAKHRVTYTGPGERIITKTDWKSIDIEADTTKWVPRSVSDQGRASVVIENMTDAQKDYFTKTDKNFKVEEVEDEDVPLQNANESRTAGSDDEPTTEGDAEGTLASPSTTPKSGGKRR